MVSKTFNVDRGARLLSLSIERPLSVSELMIKAGGNHTRSIELAKELERRGLLQREVKNGARGRPQQLLYVTPLGQEFVRQYNRLGRLSLRSSPNDIRRALREAEFAQRLAEQGVSLYARLQEINEIVRNITRTAQTGQDSR